MTFYGESLALVDAANITGTPLVGASSNIRYRAGSETINSGESFIAYVDPDPIYLTSGDAAEVSWVVEVLSGSGTLHLSDGLDPFFITGDPGAASNDLGSATASGTDTLVFPASITAADLLAATAEPVVLVECTAGSLEIQQVKLRVWPPGGAVGGWGDVITPTDTVGPIIIASCRRDQPAVGSVVSGSYSSNQTTTVLDDAGISRDTGYSAAQTYRRALLAGLSAGTARPNVVTASGGTLAQSGGGVPATATADWKTTAPSGVHAETGSNITRTYITRSVSDPGPTSGAAGVEGVDYIADPNEVPADPVAYVQITGDPTVWWVQGDISFVTQTPESGGVAYPVTGSFYVQAGAGAAPTLGSSVGGGDYATSWTPPTSAGGDTFAATGSAGEEVLEGTVSLPNVDAVAVTVTHDVVFTELSAVYNPSGTLISAGNTNSALYLGVFPGTVGANQTFTPISYSYIQAPYRRWEPVVRNAVLRWKQRDDGLGMSSTPAWRGSQSQSTSQGAARWRGLT